MKTILRKVPDEDIYYIFEDEVEIDTEKIIIYGNHNFREFGDSVLLSIVSGDYYDDDTGYEYDIFEELEKYTGKKWKQTTIKGYSQGDWQDVYYVEDEVSKEYIEEIENFYMNKISKFRVIEDDDPDYYYIVYVPDDIVWKGKDAICKYLDLQPETTLILKDDGYEKVYKYVEID